MAAYYNEIDPHAAQWLRNLIAGGHIAPGDVDERSIEDVHPDDLKPYTQCHFFAGIGVWSHALRRAGWPDDRPVWTGSCPCQPFSSAGQGDGFDDPRHLWPAFAWLIREQRPAELLGEQVASKDAEPWLDLVQADLETMGYAFGAIAFPSAGVGAPHIRDRTYWVANAHGAGRQPRGKGRSTLGYRPPAKPDSGIVRMDHTNYTGLERHAGHGGTARRQGPQRPVTEAGLPMRLADTTNQRQHGRRSSKESDGRHPPRIEPERLRDVVGLANPIGDRWEQGGCHLAGSDEANIQGAADQHRNGGPVNGLWRDADWLFCRDGKWRPVEPGTFPLAHGAPGRVGRLRAYGNAINAEAATQFIAAYLETL